MVSVWELNTITYVIVNMQSKLRRQVLCTTQYLIRVPQTITFCPNDRQDLTPNCGFVAHLFGSLCSSMLLLSEILLEGNGNYYNIVFNWYLTPSAGNQ